LRAIAMSRHVYAPFLLQRKPSWAAIHCLKAVYQFCLGCTAPAGRVHCNMRA